MNVYDEYVKNSGGSAEEGEGSADGAKEAEPEGVKA